MQGTETKTNNSKSKKKMAANLKKVNKDYLSQQIQTVHLASQQGNIYMASQRFTRKVFHYT